MITFKKVTIEDLDIIFSWLTQDHMAEFWDNNTQAHKDDVVNFAQGRKMPSTYADGKYVYWIASAYASDAVLAGKEPVKEPFAMLMTIQETHKDNIGSEKLERLSKIGNTYGLDYMIGNQNFFGKGYGARTLAGFINYFRCYVDPKADTFLINPAYDNPRAKHVYLKAGFEHVCDFVKEGDCGGAGKVHHLLVRKFEPDITLIKATLNDYPLVQNMARFYFYDLSRECGHISSDWALSEDGLYESFNFKNYFEDPSRKAYLVKVYDEVSGFVLINQATEDKTNKWNMGEFFIIGKFQNLGVGEKVARKIWEMNPGKWEISVIPQNKKALTFWEKVIIKFTGGVFGKINKDITYDEHQPKRIIFNFETIRKLLEDLIQQVVVRVSIPSDIDILGSMTKAKRLVYEKAQPQFWCYSGTEGDAAQSRWFRDLLSHQDYIMLTAEVNRKIVGFIIGKLMPAP